MDDKQMLAQVSAQLVAIADSINEHLGMTPPPDGGTQPPDTGGETPPPDGGGTPPLAHDPGIPDIARVADGPDLTGSVGNVKVGPTLNANECVAYRYELGTGRGATFSCATTTTLGPADKTWQWVAATPGGVPLPSNPAGRTAGGYIGGQGVATLSVDFAQLRSLGHSVVYLCDQVDKATQRYAQCNPY